MSKEIEKFVSPFAHLGPNAIERRYRTEAEPTPKEDAKERLSEVIRAGIVGRGVSESLKPTPKSQKSAPAKKRMGRPVTVGKPWEAEGISKAAYYKRRKKEQV